jgi:elongation factor G
MESVVDLMPSHSDSATIKARKADIDEVVELKPTVEGQLSALIFKTIADPFVGKISMLKVFSGVLKSDSIVYNSAVQKTEKIAQLFVMRGKKHTPVDKLVAGDIGAVAKLQCTNTNNTLCDQSSPVVLDSIVFPEPVISMAVEPKS